MNYAYWETKTWLTDIDFAIIGSGIVGLSCAMALRKRFPKAKIIVFEKGQLPQGASTKNAGFACFGSLSEIIADLEHHTPEDVLDLVQKRVEGLALLRKTIGDHALGLKQYGGYDVFAQNEPEAFETCYQKINEINRLLYPIFSANPFETKQNTFGFENVNNTLFYSPFDAQLDTGKMMDALLKKAWQNNIKILNATTLVDYSEHNQKVSLNFDTFEASCSHLLLATNGFSKSLLSSSVTPARAQVLITKPISGLQLKGAFHMDRGYYYFRNIDNRILLGGGRNLDFKTEETDAFGLNMTIQKALEKRLKTTILPHQKVEIEQRWSGIMGLGQHKTPLVKALGKRVFCGIRLGGMGVAIGSSVGQELARLPS